MSPISSQCRLASHSTPMLLAVRCARTFGRPFSERLGTHFSLRLPLSLLSLSLTPAEGRLWKRYTLLPEAPGRSARRGFAECREQEENIQLGCAATTEDSRPSVRINFSSVRTCACEEEIFFDSPFPEPSSSSSSNASTTPAAGVLPTAHHFLAEVQTYCHGRVSIRPLPQGTFNRLKELCLC